MRLDTDTIKLSQHVTEASEALQAAQKVLDDAVEALHRHLNGTAPKAAPKKASGGYGDGRFQPPKAQAPKSKSMRKPKRKRSKGAVRHTEKDRPSRKREAGPGEGKVERYYRSALYGSIARTVGAGTPDTHTLKNGNVVSGVWLTSEEQPIIKELAADATSKTPSGRRKAMRRRMRQKYHSREGGRHAYKAPADAPAVLHLALKEKTG